VGDFARLPPFRVSLVGVSQSALESVDWAVRAYGVPELWKRSEGEGIRVAVIDSGVAQHPALIGAVVDRRNYSQDSDAYDTFGHGTHVAGIIAARSGATKGIAPKAEIVSLKALGHSGTGPIEGVASALMATPDTGSKIACICLGVPRSNPALHEAVKHAVSRGVIVVCAAGNDGGPVYFPAAYDETIGVGAVDKSGTICEFSSRGKEIVVAAPGQDITSTWINDGYATISGTSMAAPFVVGILALYLSSHPTGRKVSSSEIKKALEETCRDAGAAGRDDEYGWGLLDPHRLIGYANPPQQGVTIYIPGARVL
jgi:subtilisin family serine protease